METYTCKHCNTEMLKTEAHICEVNILKRELRELKAENEKLKAIHSKNFLEGAKEYYKQDPTKVSVLQELLDWIHNNYNSVKDPVGYGLREKIQELLEQKEPK